MEDLEKDYIKDESEFNGGQNFNAGQNSSSAEDIPSTILNLVSCCFPIVGLILYIVWKDTKPISAKNVGKWAIVGLVIAVILYVVLFALGFLGAVMFSL